MATLSAMATMIIGTYLQVFRIGSYDSWRIVALIVFIAVMTYVEVSNAKNKKKDKN